MANVKLTLTGDWIATAKMLSGVKVNMARALKQAVKQEAHFLVAEMKKQFRDLKPPLSPNTLLTKKRGGSKPLLASGDMRNSIVPVFDGDFGVFIGVPRSANGYMLADIHENGRIIVQRITPKQRRFLHAKLGKHGSGGKGGGTGVMVIHIPARPFIGPVIEAEKDRIGPRILGRVAERVAALGGGK